MDLLRSWIGEKLSQIPSECVFYDGINDILEEKFYDGINDILEEKSPTAILSNSDFDRSTEGKKK